MNDNPYLLTAAQVRRWAKQHNEEAWVLLVKMLKGQNDLLMKKRKEEAGQVLSGLMKRSESGKISPEQKQLLKQLEIEVRKSSGGLEKEHIKLQKKLKSIDPAVKKLETKLSKVRKLENAKMNLQSRMEKTKLRMEEAARKREQAALLKAISRIEKAEAKAAQKQKKGKVN